MLTMNLWTSLKPTTIRTLAHDATAIYYTQPVLKYMTSFVALPSAAAVIKGEEG